MLPLLCCFEGVVRGTEAADDTAAVAVAVIGVASWDGEEAAAASQRLRLPAAVPTAGAAADDDELACLVLMSAAEVGPAGGMPRLSFSRAACCKAAAASRAAALAAAAADLGPAVVVVAAACTWRAVAGPTVLLLPEMELTRTGSLLPLAAAMETRLRGPVAAGREGGGEGASSCIAGTSATLPSCSSCSMLTSLWLMEAADRALSRATAVAAD